MSNTMKSYWMETNGETADISLREVAIPVPAANQLLVKMHAASLNRGEFILAHGLHKAGAAKPIGTDGSGVVEAIGADVSEFKIGDRVMGRCAGAFSEMALMSTLEAMHIPASLGWEAAASVPLTGHVVFDMLVLQGRLVKDEWLLINGVSSGVGVAALQMAKAIGAKVIGTSGSTEKLARLKALGLDVAICTREANFHDEVMAVTNGKGVNLVINTVGGSVFAEDVRCMAFEGRLAMVGYVDGQLQTNLSIEALHSKRLTLFGVSNKLRSPEQRASGVPRFRTEVLPMLADGRITPMVDQVFTFDDLARAKSAMDTNTHVGKIVLSIGD
jgi:NADPH2:quinone reductase